MNSPDRTVRIFHQALEVAPERRTGFLAQACDGDEDLQAEVESLLRHHRPETVAGILHAGRPSERSGGTASWTRGLRVGWVVAAASRLLKGRRRQAIAWFLAAAFLAGVGYWTRQRVEQSLRAQIGEQLKVVLAADVTALETWVGARVQEAGTWASRPEVQDLAQRIVRAADEDHDKAVKLRDSPLQREFAATFQPFMAEVARPEDAAVVLLDRTGLRVAATDPYQGLIGNESNERGAAALVQILEGHIRFLPPSRMDSWSRDRPADARPVLITVAPVRDSTGAIIAVLALCRLRDDGYSKILTVARMGKSGETYAISPDGLMLSPSRFDGQLKTAGFLPNQPDASSMLNTQVRDPGGDVTQGYKPALDLAARPLTMIASLAVASREKPAEEQTGVILDAYRDYRGIPVVGAWRWLPELNFAVVTEVDAQEGFALLSYVGRAFQVLFVLLTVFVGLTLVASVALARMRARDTRLGSYTLLHMIGEGGMGKVFMARHALLRRPTAVKVLKPSDSLSRESVRRFEREVQAASRLTHPNTIQIYDYGRTPEGTLYYAMEYLPGLTLAELVSITGPVEPSRVVHILKQVCGALAEAHERGLLHRDIKPLNIMLCERGAQYDFVKVLDFGLVRQLETAASLEISSPDRLIGTPVYMAPERFLDPTAVDPRSDLYSVGAVAYYLLTGRLVFQALNAVDLQNQVLHTEPELPSERLGRFIPADLDRLVLACLSKDPDQRPASAAELLKALNALFDVPAWSQAEAREWWTRHLPSSAMPVL